MRQPLAPHAILAALVLLPLVLIAGGGPVLAAESLAPDLERIRSARTATHVDADEIEYQEGRRLVVGRGDVMIRFGDRILHADEVRVDLRAQEFVASGSVLLVEGPNRLEGDRLEYNYGTNRGVVYNARGFLAPTTSFRGLEIRKVGDREFRIRRGAYTSCRVCQPEPELPSWELRGESVTIIQDEVFRATHASAWAAGTVPVLYSPLVAVPLGPRRSGFLLPRFGYGTRSGFTYRQPFYWAISESQDATLVGTFRSRRGFELGAEYRYILSPRASGEWRGLYVRDRDVQGRNRWEIHGVHDQFFTPTLNLKADINFQGDSSLGRDFADRPLVERTQRTIQTNVFLTQAVEAYAAMVRADVSRDLTNAQDTRLLRLPEVRLNVFDRPVFRLPLTVSGAASASFFERRDLPDATRADFGPRLRLPWAPTPWLGLSATVGGRETIYSVGNEGSSGTPTRTLYDVGGSAEARFLRVFDVGGRELSQVVHVVAPRVGYQFVPSVDQQHLPQFDLEDFVSPQNHLTYGLDNRFIARLRGPDGAILSREVLSLGVAQAFNFRPRTRVFSDIYLTALTPERVDNAVDNARPVLDRAGTPSGFSRADERQFTNLVFSLQARPHPLIYFRGTLAYDTAKAREEAINTQVRFHYPAWGSLGAGYTRDNRRLLEGLTVSATLALTPELGLGYLSRYDARQAIFFEHNVVARYATCCWEVSVRYINRERGPGFPTENDVRVTFELKTGVTGQATGAALAPGPPAGPGSPDPEARVGDGGLVDGPPGAR